MYNIDSGNLGAKTGFVFAGTSVLLFCISWFVVPETSGLGVEEIGTLILSSTDHHSLDINNESLLYSRLSQFVGCSLLTQKLHRCRIYRSRVAEEVSPQEAGGNWRLMGPGLSIIYAPFDVSLVNPSAYTEK